MTHATTGCIGQFRSLAIVATRIFDFLYCTNIGHLRRFARRQRAGETEDQ